MSDWNPRANNLFLQALDCTDPAERASFLDRACGSDPTLRYEVETLLRAHDQAGAFLHAPHPAVASVWEHPGADPDAAPPHPLPPGPGVVIAARYRLLRPIGEGGMGSVWLGEQTEPVKRLVAVKVVRADGRLSKRIVARFEAERQAIALMDHPHIARLFDAGTTDDGSPFFVMELVAGVPLTEFCDAHRLSVPGRLKLLVRVCAAVQHAHQKGVIHRDLKPANILVEAHEGAPVPKVIDFGLAKAVSGLLLTDHPLLTAFGTVAGTPLYMSPEQAALDAADVDTRADVYALGAILYELLTGTTPIARDAVARATTDEVLRMIREHEPPSLMRGAEFGMRNGSAMPHSELRTPQRRELDWIVMKALAKERDRRYESAGGLAADIERFLNHEPVLAGPPDTAYRLRKFVRRNRPQVVAGALVLLALVVGMFGTTVGMVEARRQARIAQEKQTLAERAESETLVALRSSTDDAVGQLIGSKPDLGPGERAYLQRALSRWQEFAARAGDDERSRAVRAEGHLQVGALWQRLDRHPEARSELESARDLFAGLVDEFPGTATHRRRLAEARRILGAVLVAQGRAAEARTELEAARDLLVALRLVSDDLDIQQDLARTHTGLGTALRNLNEPDRARSEFEQARDIWQRLTAALPHVARLELATAHNFLGILLADRGRHDEAIKEYELARDHFRALADEHPDEPEDAMRLAQAHNNIGLAYKQLDRFDAALSEYNRAVVVLRPVADRFPSIPRYRRTLAATYNAIGIYAKVKKRWDEARAAYRAAIDVHRQLADEFPTVVAYRQGLARAHNNLGNVAYSVGDWKEAGAQYQAALALHQQLAAQLGSTESRLDLASTHQNTGNLTRDASKLTESLPWYGDAIGILNGLRQADPGNAEIRERLRDAHFHRGETFKRLGSYAQAVDDFDRAVELTPPPRQGRVRAYRAEVLLRTGRVADAVAEADELTGVGDPDLQDATRWEMELWYNFACIYSVASGAVPNKKGEYGDRAVRLLKQAVSAGFADAAHLAMDADLAPLRDRDDFRQLLAKVKAQSARKGAPGPPYPRR